MRVGRYIKNWNPREYYLGTSVAESYDDERFSSLSGSVFNWLEKGAIARALADIPAGSRIADIPCGTGRLAEVALNLGHHVTGFDISPAMLQVARRRLKRFGNSFVSEVKDANDLKMEGAHFDVVLCARFLMHFPFEDQTQFMDNFSSVTERRIIFTQGVVTPVQRLRRRIKQLIGRFQAPAAFPITTEQLRALLANAGLREVRRYRVLPLLSESVVVVAERYRDKGSDD